MPQPNRGDVWLVDFGLAGKTRPAVVVNVPFGIKDRTLITVVPHTTSLRGSTFEITVSASFLKPGAFLVQGVATVPTVDALHRLGALSPEAFGKVLNGLLAWLGVSANTSTRLLINVTPFWYSFGHQGPPANSIFTPVHLS